MNSKQERTLKSRTSRVSAIHPDRPAHRRELLSGTALSAMVAAGLFAFSTPALAQVSGLQGGVVVGGQATIANTAPGHVTITQSTNRGVIDWRSFSIAAGERVDFLQPGTSSVTLNRVTGPDPSVIAGQLNATGQLILVNGAGVVFANGAQVNAAGLVAATSTLTDPQRFMQGGTVAFNRASSNPNAGVSNAGTITVRDGGLVGLVGNTASNSGTINARLGRVSIAGAETFTVDLAGDGLINFQVGNPVSRQPVDSQGRNVALASNSGTINADGGTVQLTARAARGVVDNVVNAGGTINARVVRNEGGVVVFGADDGTVNVTGTIDVSGNGRGQRGGQVVATGARATVNVASTANINASGHSGGGRVNIGGNRGGQGPLANARDTSVAAGARIAADAMARGDGGTVIVWADNTTVFGGTITAKGGATSGHGGFVEVSGKQYLDYRGLVDVRAANGATGTLLLDPANINIQNNGTNNTSQTGGDPNTITGNANTSILTVATLQAALATANVVVDAANSPGTAVGTITVNDPITSTSGNSLTFRAAANIDLNNNAINIGTGTLAFFSTGGNLVGGGAALTASAVMFNMSGNVTLNNANNNFASINGTAGGFINIRTAGALDVAGLVSGGDVTLRTFGNLSFSGSVTTPQTNGVVVSLRADNNGTITQGAAVGITTRDLSINNTNAAVSLVGSANNIQRLGAIDVNAGAFTLVNNGDLTIVGNGSAAGGYSAATTGTLTVTNPINAGAGLVRLQGTSLTTTAQLTGGNVTLIANQVVLGQNVNVGAGGTATIAPLTSGTAVTLGNSATPSGLVIDNTELGRLSSASALSIGRSDTGMTTAGPIQVGVANVANSTLNLFTSGGVMQDGLLTVNAGSGTLNIAAGGTVALGNPAFGVHVSVVGGSTTSGNFVILRPITASGSLTVSGITTTDGAVEVRNLGGSLLVAGAVMANSAIEAAGIGDVTLISAGGINLAAAITTAGTVTLFSTGGSVTQTAAAGTITATALQAQAAGTVDLGAMAANNVGTFAASAGTGMVQFINFRLGGLNIGTVTAAAGTTSGVTAANGNVTLRNQADLNIAAAITANTTNGIVSLVSIIGSVNETTGGTVTAGGLEARAAFDIGLTQSGNNIGGLGFAAFAGNGFVRFVNQTSILVTQVGASTGVTAADTGVSLQAVSGNISQSANTIIATDGPLVVTANAGDITLDQPNLVGGSFVAFAGGNVTLRNTGDIVIGHVGTGGPGITASTAAGAFVSLISDTGMISQVAGLDGRIIGNELRLATTDKNAILTNAGNEIAVLGTASLGSGRLALVDSTGDLTVTGPLVATGGIDLRTAGILTLNVDLMAGAGDVTLQSGNDLLISRAITTTGTVSLTSTAGSILQMTGDAVITANAVVASAFNDVDLSPPLNFIGAGGFAAVATNGFVAVANATPLHITTVGAISGVTAAGVVLLTVTGDLTQSASGIITAGGGLAANASGSVMLDRANRITGGVALNSRDGDVTFRNMGAIRLDRVGVVRGNGNGELAFIGLAALGVGSLISDTGGITQAATNGDIQVNELRVTTHGGDVTLTNATNQFVNLGASDLGTGKLTLVELVFGVNVTGAVNAGGGVDLSTNGAITVNAAITAANGSVNLLSAVDIQIAAAINAGNIVRLTSMTGSIVQTTANGVVTASGLAASAMGNVEFGLGNNHVGAFAAASTTGYVLFLNSGTLNLDKVGDVSGVTAAGPVFLGVTGGDLTQSAQGLVTSSGGFAAFAEGNIVLDQANHVTGDFAILETPGNVTLRNTGDINIGVVGPVTIVNGDVVSASGLVASQAPGAFVSLISDTGTVSQAGGVDGAIVGGQLRITTTNRDVALVNTANDLTGLGDSNLGSGRLSLFDGIGGLNIAGNVRADGGVALVTQQTLGLTGTVTAGSGDIAMTSLAGGIQLAGTLSAMNGVVALQAGGAGGTINQTGGMILASRLLALAPGNIDLPSVLNNVAMLAGASTGGTFRYRNAGALAVGSISGFNGVITNGQDIGIHAGGDLHLAGAIDTRGAAGGTTAIVRLQATNGNVTQDPGAGIFAGTLLVNTIGMGDVLLTSPANLIQSGGPGGTGVVVGTSAGAFMVTSGNPNTLTNVAVTGDAGLAIIGFRVAPANQPTTPMLINNCYVEGSQSCEQQPADPPGVEGLEMLRTLTMTGPTQVNFGDSTR